MVSAMFAHLERLHGDLPWGAVLDAGTGVHSLQWIAGLDTERWTAVTGAQGHGVQVRDAVADRRRAQDRILLANWTDPDLLQGECYDTVIADYLLGAIEGFAPYFQPQLFPRLRPLVGRRLYVIGLEPYVAQEPESAAGKMVWAIGRFRDTCLLLAGEAPYREYPEGWAIDHIARAGFRVIAAERYAIRYKARFIDSQIDMCRPRIARLVDRGLAAALERHGEQLRAQALALAEAEGGLSHGHDYLIAAEPV